MSAPDVVMTICPPFAVVASKALIVDAGLTPRKSFATTLNGAARFAELILTLPVTVTGKVSLTATGDAASVPARKLVFGSTVSLNCTPRASSPVAPRLTVYFSVSPGSALPSLSASTTSASVFVAVIVGTNGAAVGPTGRWESTDADAEPAVFAGSGLLLLGGVGCDFHSPALLELTVTEN